MTNLQRIWTDQYRVNWFDADINNQAKLVSICRYLQESAWNHASHLGFGYRDANDIKQVWVIVRLLIKMERYPSWEDIVTIQTWPRGVEGHLALRDFLILSSDGERLGAAASQWFILDAASHKPQPMMIVRDILPLATHSPAMEESPQKIVIRDPMDHVFTARTGYSDLDMYGHVNNTRYIEWIMNVFPEEKHRESQIRLFNIEYVSEAFLGDEIGLFSGEAEGRSLIRGVRSSDGKTIFRCRIEWQ